MATARWRRDSRRSTSPAIRAEAARCWWTTSTSSPATTSGPGRVAWRWGAACPGTRGPSRRSPCASCSTTASSGSSPDTAAACAFPRSACGRPWKSWMRGPSRFPEQRRRSAAGAKGGHGRQLFRLIRQQRAPPHGYGDAQDPAQVDPRQAETEAGLRFLLRAAMPEPPLPIVGLPFLRIRQDDERLGDLAEVLHRVRGGVHVRVERAGELAVDRLDRLEVLILGNAEHIVEIPLRHENRIHAADLRCTDSYTAALAAVIPARIKARDIRGVLYAHPSRPSGPATMIPPSPCARSRSRPTASMAAARGEAPSRTRTQAARARLTLRIASPSPVELAAASLSSA